MQRPLELWGGAECTLNRVGERYSDQTVRTGHAARGDDLERFAGLGLRALRQAVLWEATPRNEMGAYDLEAAAERLGRLRALGLRPIVGLIHHGSGPPHTSLLEAGFASGLADFASAVAERFPWVDDWTPVNEPLTTARFSCLYGHWSPHRRDERDFWTALLNQIDAVRLSMRAIRTVNPRARLVQTEDLGRTYATPALRFQADYNNARRWMTWDLLCGTVTAGHPLWDHLVGLGFQARLEVIAADRCPPEVIGVNHYLTSDRFLDERLERYPSVAAGGTAAGPYVDVEALRVLPQEPAGLGGALRECWARYGRTIAVTECHNGCTREEQIRWLRDAWAAALSVRRDGGDVEAVTAWSLLGAYDWNSLLTRFDGHYEPGAFDVRTDPPTETAVAKALAALASDRPLHPAADGPGWWSRSARLLYPAASYQEDVAAAPRRPVPAARLALLIVQADFEPPERLLHACRRRNLEHRVQGADAGLLSGGLAWAVLVLGAAPATLVRECRDRGLAMFVCGPDLQVVTSGSLCRASAADDASDAAADHLVDWLIDETSAALLATGGTVEAQRAAS